jgi:hypothetical protein
MLIAPLAAFVLGVCAIQRLAELPSLPTLSHSSSSEMLLESVAPAVAVAQAGYRNRFGHPDPWVAARYAARGIELIRTDHAGAAQWRYAPGTAVGFRSWRATAVRYWHNRPAAGRTGAATEPDEALEEVERREPLFGMP